MKKNRDADKQDEVARRAPGTWTRRKLALLGMACLLLIGGIGGAAFSYVGARASRGNGNPLLPPEANTARQANAAFVIGDLGGVPVRIPSWFADYVEYDGDPGFGEQRKGPVPERTYRSPLISFGFKVRFPDMAGRSSPALQHDDEQYGDPHWKGYYDSVSPWLAVGFNTGSIYPGDGFLDRYIKTTLSFNAERAGLSASKVYEYEKLEKAQFGLTVYAPPGMNPKTNRPYREDDNARDLFVHWSKDGKVDTYIECTNRNGSDLKHNLCNQDISMAPGMRARVYIQYPRYWLPHWKEIQHKVAGLVWSFRVEDGAIAPSVEASPSIKNN
jgi:hypothetical protein